MTEHHQDSAQHHPRMFAGPDDVAALRQRVRVPGSTPARALALLEKRCGGYLNPQAEQWLDPAWDRDTFLNHYPYGAANHIGGPLHDLAFAWMATESADYLSCLRRLMQTLCVIPGDRQLRTGPHSAQYVTVDTISRLTVNGDLAVALDLVGAAIPAQEREQLATMLRTEVVIPYQHDFLAKPQLYSALLGTNPPWHEMVVYAWTLAAVYDPTTDAEAMQELADIVRRAIHRGADDAGVIAEGSNYGRHDLFRWVSIAVILKRIGVADLWAEEPQLTQMLDLWGHLVLPAQRLTINFADTPAAYGAQPVYALLMSARAASTATVRERHQGLHRLLYDSSKTLGDDLGSAGLLMLWERDTPAPTPSDAGMPLDLMPSRYGVGIFRSSWDDEAVVTSLLAAGRSSDSVIHQQADAGHFSLYAHGESYSIDAGYGDNEAECHSTMVPEGASSDAWVGGHVRGSDNIPHAAWMQVDTSAQWACQWCFRDLLLLRDPTWAQYTILIDEANLANDWASYFWRLNTAAGNQIALSPATHADGVDQATIHGKRHRLEIAFAAPDPADYPKPHAIQLRAEERHSKTYDYVRNGLVLGQGGRPQLVAQLDGYNGRLLTALLPRREAEPPVGVHAIHGPVQQGLVLDFGTHVDTIVANSLDRRLALAGIHGECRLAIARRSPEGHLLAWSAVDAYALTIDGQTCLPRQGQPNSLAYETIS